MRLGLKMSILMYGGRGHTTQPLIGRSVYGCVNWNTIIYDKPHAVYNNSNKPHL